MNKPLHKDRSFWIVAITLVVAANVAQFNFGVPWLQEKMASSRPAPRMTNAAPTMGRSGMVQQENLDLRKKTYSWQRPRFEPRLLQETPPQVVLLPSEYTPPSGGWGSGRSNNAIGIRMSAVYVMQSAYHWPSPSRIIQATELPPGQFDFIANLPSGALEALQAEIKKQWKLVADREIRQTNVLILKLDHTNAPGLQAVTDQTLPRQSGPGVQTIRGTLTDFFVVYLENILRQPVIDQTGLTGVFDIQLPAYRNISQPGNGALEQTRKALLETLGLDLVQTNTSVEMLVVKKAKEENP